MLRETVRRNRVRDGIVYLQVTRGVARRDSCVSGRRHAAVAWSSPRAASIAARLEQLAADGIAVITVPDNRWARVDIKSVALLPNVLAKQAAREQGAREAWFVDAQGRVTEGSSSNAWIVTRDGKLVTRPARPRHPAGHHPHGRARSRSRRKGLSFEERAFTRRRSLCGARGLHHLGEPDRMPVVRIDGRPVGNGAPGLVATALRRDFHRHAEISLSCAAITTPKTFHVHGLGRIRKLCLRPSCSLPSNGGS